MFLLAHHAGIRAEEEENAYELAEAVAELRRKLDPEAERKLAAAREAVEEAQGLREKAYYRRRGVRDATDLYARGAYWTAS
jgi:hypothetical protein